MDTITQYVIIKYLLITQYLQMHREQVFSQHKIQSPEKNPVQINCESTDITSNNTMLACVKGVYDIVINNNGTLTSWYLVVTI